MIMTRDYRKRSNKRPLSNKRFLSNKRPPYAVKLVLNATCLINSPPPLENCPQILGNGEIEQNQSTHEFHCLINIILCVMSCSISR